jgi:hypothetical protein
MNINILGYDVVLKGRRTSEYCHIRGQGCTSSWDLIGRATELCRYRLHSYHAYSIIPLT